MRVECSKDMRTKHPIGTIFRVHAKLVTSSNLAPFLYSHYAWGFEVLIKEKAKEILDASKRSAANRKSGRS
jgi:hypothetical protein